MPARRPPPPDALTYAIGYARVSSQDQAREGISLDAQLAACRRYAAALGWILGAEFIDVLSGTRDDRPQYQAMLADVRQRRAQAQAVAVVVLRLDRLGRRLMERVRAYTELDGIGVPIHSVAEGGVVPPLVANILASVAQEEVRLIGARVSEARAHLARGGWWSGGRTPWAYQLRPATAAERAAGAPQNVLDLDPDAVPFAEELVARFVAGASVHSLARWVRTLPAAARGGRQLRYANLREWLRSPFPRGLLDGAPARWPAIIAPDQVAAIDARMAQWARGRRHASGRYLLTGFLRCPRCGATMVGHRSVPPRTARYHCTRGALGGTDARCPMSATVAAVDTAVLNAVTARLAPALARGGPLQRALRQAWAEVAQTPRPPAQQAQQQALERARAQAQRRLRDAATLYVDGGLDRAGYEAVRQEAEAALTAASAALSALQAAPPVSLPGWAAVRALSQDWPRLAASRDPEALRPILTELIEMVMPERVSYGRWAARMTWTALGEALGVLGGTQPE
jgi:DNA invertase Pin-like site-specific DNA recombinase